MKKNMCLALFFCVGLTAFAVNTATRQVKGVGKTRKQAIDNALYEAVGQVQGVVVTSGVASSAASVGSIDVTREEVDKSIEMEGISVRGMSTVTMTLAQGLVKSYEVVEETEFSDGKWEVTVKVDVYDYQSPLASTKQTLAVSSFEMGEKIFVFGDVRVGAEDLRRQFIQRLTTLFNDSGRFNLLDRSYDKAFRDEAALLRSVDTNIEEKSRLQNVLGADYLLTGRIRQFTIDTEVKELPATGYKSEEYRGHLSAEVQLLVPATRQVAFSHEYRLKLKTNDIKLLADDWKRDERNFDQIKDAFMDMVAGRILEDLLGDLFPVRVAQIDQDKVIIDQGGERIKAGTMYEVFKAGKEVLDPQTGQSLGAADVKIATLEITRVMPKFSYAKAIEGKISQVQIDQVCRIHPDSQKLQPEPEGGMKSRVRRLEGGGVKMPFD